MLVVDAANVVGSRPDGWWRDRAGAARRLVAQVRAAADDGRLPVPVVVVLEGAARQGAVAGTESGVEVVHAPGEGDDAIVTLVAALDEPAVVVTADRGLRGRVVALASGAAAAGTLPGAGTGSQGRRSPAEVVGPRWLLQRLAAGPP